MKPTTVELDRRVEEVKQALINAATRYAIVQNVTARYGVNTRTADSYIAKAKKALKAEYETNAPYLIAEHIAHRRNLRERARRAGDLALELKVAADEAKLQGLYPAVRTELSGKDGGPVAVDHTHKLTEATDDDIKRTLEALGQSALAASGRTPVHDDPGGAEGADTTGEEE